MSGCFFETHCNSRPQWTAGQKIVFVRMGFCSHWPFPLACKTCLLTFRVLELSYRHGLENLTYGKHTEAGAQPGLKSWGGPRFGSQHPGVPGQRPSWVLGAGEGRSLPLWGSGVSSPENFLENSDAKSGLPRTWNFLLFTNYGQEVGGTIHCCGCCELCTDEQSALRYCEELIINRKDKN